MKRREGLLLGGAVVAGFLLLQASSGPKYKTWAAFLADHPETKGLPYGITADWLAATLDRPSFVWLAQINPGRKMNATEAGAFWDKAHFVGMP